MEKPVVIFEITNTSVRVIIGNTIDNKPVILFTTERPIEGYLARGEIADFSALVSTLTSLRYIYDETNMIKYNVSEATLIFPPAGFIIQQGDKMTNVVSPSGVINDIDIQNVISLVQKEPVPNGCEIVDIIPDAFYLEQSRQFLNPPIGEKSNFLKLMAKVQALPTRIVSDYKRALEAAGIHARRCLISSHAITELNKIDTNMPHSYILIDMGAGNTNISLVGNDQIYSASQFTLGGNDLALKIADEFSLSYEEAKKLMETYGVNSRKLSFSPVIAESIAADGTLMKFTPNDLNKVIKEFAESYYFKQMDGSLGQILVGYKEDNPVRRLPIVVTGGFSKLNGLKELFKDKYPNNQLFFLSPKAIGVRDPKYSSLVGALISSSHYRGTLSDTRAKVTHVDRDNTKN